MLERWPNILLSTVTLTGTTVTFSPVLVSAHQALLGATSGTGTLAPTWRTMTLSDLPGNGTITITNNASNLVATSATVALGGTLTITDNTTGNRTMASLVVNGTSNHTGASTFGGNLTANGTANQLETLQLKSGTNKSAGTATLVAGTLTVANSRVTTTSDIFLMLTVAGGTLGVIVVTPFAGSFTLASTNLAGTANTLETSTFRWILLDVY